MALIGPQLRQVRKARGWTQARLAEETGIPRTDVVGIENNRISVGKDRLLRLAAALRVSVLELSPEEEPDQPGLMLLDRLAEVEEALGALGVEIGRLARRVAVVERRDSPRRRRGASSG